MRPRLSDRALVRRHFIDGIERYVVHDGTRNVVHVLPADAWQLLRLLDGTRTEEEVAAALTPNATPRLVETLVAIGTVQAMGVLEDGPPAARPFPGLYAPCAPAEPDRIEQIRGFRLRCEGQGECCVFFTSIGLGAADVERARRAPPRRLPILGLGPGDDAWTPLTGANRDDAFAMNLVNGQCIELEADRRCGLHGRGGWDAKPVGCRAHPFVFLDDGERLRVSVGADCSCVFQSLDALEADGAAVPFEDPRDVPSELVRHLPDEIAVTERVRIARAEVAEWSRGMGEARSVADPIGVLLEHAASFRARAYDADPHGDHAPIEPWRALDLALAGFARSASALARTASMWRSPNDVARGVLEAVATAANATLDPDRVTALRDHAALFSDESFFVRALLYGHAFTGPLVPALVGMAARLVVARELETRHGRTPRHPIAMVELVCRQS